MWLLKKLSDGTNKYLISELKIYTVGRKNCDIILEEDASISRKHCSIYIAKRNECPFTVNTLTGVWIVDEKSKYGTYLKSNNEWMMINPNQNKKLSSGSIIKFGLIDNIWSLEFKPLIACTSGIQTERKKKILSILQSIDGCLMNTWCKECSLVIVDEIILTIKVVLALINGIPIVTPNYLEKVVESIKNHTVLPVYEDYRPSIKESIIDASLVSLDVKKNRKELFRGKTFVIPTRKQLETLNEVITSAGGKTELFSSAANLNALAEENTIVIQLPLNCSTITKELDKSFKEITSQLKSNFGRRIIPESEIAQAVAYSSIEKYCNPKSTCFTLLRIERQFDPGVSLVQETPETPRAKFPHPCVVPSSATIDSQVSTTVPSQLNGNNKKDETQKFSEDRKRIHSPDQFDQELKIKKFRNKSTYKEEDALAPQETVENKTVQSSSIIEADSYKIKKGASKTACIANFFSKLPVKGSAQVPQQKSPKFWNQDGMRCDRTKRKLSAETNDLEEHSNKKRVNNIPEPEVEGQQKLTLDCSIQNPRKAVKVVEPISTYKSSAPSLRFSNVGNAESDFIGYIEKEKTEDLNEYVDNMSKTVFSSTLISPAFLKDDGSLVDPPSVPINVKKFKKQKIHSSVIVVSMEQNEDAVSDGEWIEPHSGRLNISLDDGSNW